MTKPNLYKKASEILGIPESEVRQVYEHYWFWIAETIASFPIDPHQPFVKNSKIAKSINIPLIGKLVFTENRFKHIQKAYERDKTNKDGETSSK